MAERIKAGIQNAKAEGVKIGRKPKTPIEISKIIQIYEEAKEKGKNISNWGIKKDKDREIYGILNHLGLCKGADRQRRICL